MSMEATVKGWLGIDFKALIDGNLSLGVARIRRGVGVQEEPARPADTTTDVVVGNTTSANWFASVVGAFDDDPGYAQIIENIRENRRRMAAEYEAVE